VSHDRSYPRNLVRTDLEGRRRPEKGGSITMEDGGGAEGRVGGGGAATSSVDGLGQVVAATTKSRG
jgi:hypothetical protein